MLVVHIHTLRNSLLNLQSNYLMEKLAMADERFYATGKRKNAIARVWITPGTGKVIVNKMTPDDYFGGIFQIQKD